VRSRKGPAHVGIEVRHKKACATRSGGNCNCRPSYRAEVHDTATGRPMKSPTFKALADARAWRNAHLAGPRASTTMTVREAALDWLDRAKQGRAVNRSGDRFKPKVLRDYESALNRYILPSLGAVRLDRVGRRDVQHLVERIGLTAQPSTVRNALMPLRTIYRDAMQRDWVAINPTAGIALPAARGKRDRIAPEPEARALIALLPVPDQGIWAAAFYAGLRLGEIQALRWQDVDFERRVLHVRSSWDPKEGPVLPKSRAGIRSVPLIEPLYVHLSRRRGERADPEGLVFGRSESRCFSHNAVRDRAKRLWDKAGLVRIGFHEARHTYASWMIAAGVDAKSLSTYMGHSSISITLDLYGHLLPGNEALAAKKLETFLASATPPATPENERTAETPEPRAS
jgi:integrase